MSSENAVVKINGSSPAAMIQTAIQGGADLEKLEKLLELQERWEANEARKAYNEAMSNFREECPTIGRTRSGHNNKYAGLAETIEQIKPLLSRHGLSHRWATGQNEKAITVECTVTHKQGHSESTSLSAGADTSGNKNSIQAIGSTVAYLERYTLYAILGLASREMDDDGGAGGSVQYITEAQVADLEALIAEVGADKVRFLKFLKVETLDGIPASWHKRAVETLESKRGAK